MLSILMSLTADLGMGKDKHQQQTYRAILKLAPSHSLEGPFVPGSLGKGGEEKNDLGQLVPAPVSSQSVFKQLPAAHPRGQSIMEWVGHADLQACLCPQLRVKGACQRGSWSPANSSQHGVSVSSVPPPPWNGLVPTLGTSGVTPY